MPLLDVSGATLEYTTTTGSGPHIILVPGVPGSQSVFRFLVPLLARTRTVTTYSRRGLSGSQLRGAQDYPRRLDADADADADADDLAALVRHVADGDACVFGSSSGAIVALRFLERHLDLPLKVCVAHEPPSIMVLPAEVLPEREEMHRALYALYREKGAPHALETFASFFDDGKDRAGMGLLMDPAASADMRADVTYWLERECPYVFEKVDLEALGKAGDRLVLSVGKRSKDGVMGQPTFALMERLGMSEERLLVVPGGHISYITDAEELAEALSRL